MALTAEESSMVVAAERLPRLMTRRLVPGATTLSSLLPCEATMRSMPERLTMSFSKVESSLDSSVVGRRGGQFPQCEGPSEATQS